MLARRLVPADKAERLGLTDPARPGSQGRDELVVGRRVGVRVRGVEGDGGDVGGAGCDRLHAGWAPGRDDVYFRFDVDGCEVGGDVCAGTWSQSVDCAFSVMRIVVKLNWMRLVRVFLGQLSH